MSFGDDGRSPPTHTQALAKLPGALDSPQLDLAHPDGASLYNFHSKSLSDIRTTGRRPRPPVAGQVHQRLAVRHLCDGSQNRSGYR